MHNELGRLTSTLINRDAKKAGEEGDWKKKTRDRWGWKRLADEAVKSCRQHITPDKGKKMKREKYQETSRPK